MRLLYEDENDPVALCPTQAGLVAPRPTCAYLPTRPLSPYHIKRDESRKRQAWLQYRSWSRITSSVVLSVIGAVQYGTSKVFYKIVLFLMPTSFAPLYPSSHGGLQQNRQRGRHGRRSERAP